MPRGIPNRVMERWERLNRGPLARLVVYVEPRAVEELELLVQYRLGPRSRSAIVREAIDSELVRHAELIIRLRRRRERERQAAEQLRRGVELSVEQRERHEREVTVADAIAIVREDD